MDGPPTEEPLIEATELVRESINRQVSQRLNTVGFVGKRHRGLYWEQQEGYSVVCVMGPMAEGMGRRNRKWWLLKNHSDQEAYPWHGPAPAAAYAFRRVAAESYRLFAAHHDIAKDLEELKTLRDRVATLEGKLRDIAPDLTPSKHGKLEES